MMVPHKHLLIVDDDIELLDSLTASFACYGFAVESVSSAEMLRAKLADVALVVLEPLVVQAGLAVLRELVERGVPVIVHSRAGSDAERIAALEMGAEDCLAKPAHPRELLARIRTALRGRTADVAPARRDSVRFDGWRVDLMTGQLFTPTGSAVPLSDGEFQLLRVFVEHPRQVLDRARLLDRVYGRTSDYFDRSIDVQLCRLRRKLAAFGLKGPVIRTIRNEGYMFVHSVFG